MFPLPFYVVACGGGFCLYWILQTVAGRRDCPPALQPIHLSKEVVDQETERCASDKSLCLQGPGRKAVLTKTYYSNDSSVVKVISSQGKTLAKSIVDGRHRLSNQVIKPKVPPKRIPKDPVPLPEIFPYDSNPQDSCEDEELRAIEENVRNQQDSREAKVLSSSPDLPLPPPPASTETEVLPTDDPLPPPPGPGELPISDFNCVTSCFSHIGHRSSISDQSIAHLSSKIQLKNYTNACNFKSDETQVHFVKTSPDRTTLQTSPKVSGSELSSASRLQIESFDEDNENEAIYVNLDFQNRLNQKLGVNTTSKSFHISPIVSVTNSATQTSDTTPSLHRKGWKTRNEYDHSQKEPTGHNQESNQNLSTSMPLDTLLPIRSDRKTPLATKDNGYTDILMQSSSNAFTHGNNTRASRDDVGLPLTSPYFTTSEPKAKLLTRYCLSFDKEWTDQVELKGQKDELIESISKKLNILRLEQIELKEEMEQNEELGREVTAKIEKIAKPNELQKYKIHVEELEKIINLLLSLSGRLARAENALLILPEDAQAEEKTVLQAKRNKLSQQHDEAWHLKENIDRRSCQVSLFLHHYLSKEEYADYEHFIKMKSKLLMDARELDEKIKLGEEQLSALHGTFQVQHLNGETEGRASGEFSVLDKT